jgi:hypothetical protein
VIRRFRRLNGYENVGSTIGKPAPSVDYSAVHGRMSTTAISARGRSSRRAMIAFLSASTDDAGQSTSDFIPKKVPMAIESKSFARFRRPSDGISPIGDPKTCLEPEEFTPFVRETIEPGRRKTIVEHLATCTTCRSLVATVRRDEFPRGTPRERKRLLWSVAGLLAVAVFYYAPDLIFRFARTGFGRPKTTITKRLIVDESSLRDEMNESLRGHLTIDNETFRPFTLEELRKIADERPRGAQSGPRIRPSGRLLERRPTITIDRLDIGVPAKVTVIKKSGESVVEWIVDPNAERPSADRVTIAWPTGYPELDPGSDYRIVAEIGVGPTKFEISSNIKTMDFLHAQVIPILMEFPYELVREELRPLLNAQFLMRHGLFADALPLAEEALQRHDTSPYFRAVLDAVAADQGIENR